MLRWLPSDLSAPYNSSLNLRLLGQTFASVSELCRAAGINRQQMNKYLNGSTQPRPETARRIAAAAGLAEDALFASPAEFAELLEKSARARLNGSATRYLSERTRQSASQFPEAFLGCYWFFCRLPLLPNVILRSVMRLSLTAGGVETRFFERVQTGFPPLRAGIRRNSGIATWTAEKIFIHESPISRPAGPSLLVMLPDYEGQVATMHGLQLYNLTSGSRLPYAVRVTLRQIRDARSPLDALRSCGVFHEDDPSIEDDVRISTKNPVTSEDNVLFPYLA